LYVDIETVILRPQAESATRGDGFFTPFERFRMTTQRFDILGRYTTMTR